MFKRFLFLNVISLFSFFICLGCSDSVPDVILSKSSVIFSYNDYDVQPSVRLATFIETASDPRRVESFSVESLKENITWSIDEPVLYSESNRKFVGYTNFVTPKGMKIPTGSYKIVYTDAQDRTVECFSYVSYPEELLKLNSVDAEKFIGKNVRENIVVYNSNDEIVYFGERKKNWSDDESIFNSNKDYEKYRRCLNMIDDSVICLMPIITKESLSNSNINVK